MSDLLVVGKAILSPSSPKKGAKEEGAQRSGVFSREQSPRSTSSAEQQTSEDEEVTRNKFIAVGVCAMDTKVSGCALWILLGVCAISLCMWEKLRSLNFLPPNMGENKQLDGKTWLAS